MAGATFYLYDADAPVPTKPPHLGACTILQWQDKVLLEHRSDNDSWGFIGGGVELNETIKAAAVREMQEETGIVLPESELHLLQIFDHPQRIARYADGNVLRLISFAYTARIAQKPPLRCSAESTELRFVNKQELLGLCIVETHRDILQAFLQTDLL